MKRVRLRISGRVQGVGFRYSVSRQARALGLTGSAVNRPDGTVEVVAEGEDEHVDSLVHWCGHGPAGARVDEVEVAWEEPTGGEGFELR